MTATLKCWRLEIGDALERDCRVEEITHGWPVLKRLEKIAVNIDELDYLAKRLTALTSVRRISFKAWL